MNKQNELRVGIIGVGMVGGPILHWFEEVKGYTRQKNLFCFDVDKSKGHNDDINKADVVFVAVPTPTLKNGYSDTSIVEQAIETINDGKIIVIKSTIPPGTTEALQKKFPKKKFIFNPEFLTESQVWSDFVHPDRQILGLSSSVVSDAREIMMLLPMASFMRPWSTDYTKKTINSTEAEISKYASNIFGYMKVIYGNMLADISAGVSELLSSQGVSSGANYENIREVLSADPRIGPAWLNVNHGDYSGAGGFCFPKDMNAFITFLEKELILSLVKDKKVDRGLINSLKNGLIVLKSVRDYNRSLLKWQGLSEVDLSTHNVNIDVSKKKAIRQTRKRSL